MCFPKLFISNACLLANKPELIALSGPVISLPDGTTAFDIGPCSCPRSTLAPATGPGPLCPKKYVRNVSRADGGLLDVELTRFECELCWCWWCCCW